jgi:hypothetical protein
MKIMLMADDGEYVIDNSTHDTIDDAREYSGNFGSKWIFYPYVFIVNDSELTVLAGCDNLDYMKGKRVKTVQKLFKEYYNEHHLTEQELS